MSSCTIVAEQAIFTSIRSPLGEGYRIVAASRGFKPGEKQALTRCSPSHDTLCESGDSTGAEPVGMAFYPLPSGRFCAAFSCHAGAEHTARGGQRVYTHNVVFDEADFARCGFNPFAVLRALCQSGASEPQLCPNPLLPTVELTVDSSVVPALERPVRELLATARRGFVLRCLLDAKPVAVELPDGWTSWAEAILLGVPGPLRAKMSFGAGLRFSVGRGHRLQIFRDEKHAASSRAAAQGMCYVDSETSGVVPDSAWHTFVDRHWEKGDVPGLMRRTSRAFIDCSMEARERIGRLYNAMDALPQTDSAQILTTVGRTFAEPARAAEHEVQVELCHAAQQTLLGRFCVARWNELQGLWTPLLTLWRRGGEAATFGGLLVASALRRASADDPFAAGEAALEVAREIPLGVDRTSFDSLFSEILNRMMASAANLPESRRARAADLVRRWQAARPKCPIVASLAKRFAPPKAEAVRAST